MSRRELLAGVAGAAAAPAMARDRWADIVAFIDAGLADGVYPGAALIASRNGKVAFERCWGAYCSLTDRATALNLSVRHSLYSYSKLVSATVVVMAHQDGLVSYDVPVSTYVAGILNM